MSSVPTTAGTVGVLLFAGMAEVVGARRLEISWDGGTVADLRRRLVENQPTLGPLLARSALCVSGRYAADDVTVVVGDEVAVIPPVSGG